MVHDRTVVAAASTAAAGAWLARPVPIWLVLALSLAAVGLRRRPAGVVVVLVLGGVVASLLGARAWAGLDPPIAGTRVEAWATVLSDPVRSAGAVRADLRLGSSRVEAWARGAAGSTLAGAAAGERVRVRGRLGPVADGSRVRSAARHVAARLQVDAIDDRDAGSIWARAVNRVRQMVGAGARPLTDDQAALYTGMVVGDDRNMSAARIDDFRGAGLSHLTAVSGQNVAFVLVLAGPLLRRVGLRWRWVLTVGVIAAFAAVTRFEPSVLRASAMAAGAATAHGLGWPQSRLRLVAIAVLGLLLVDPLLVRSAGFQLSVGATLGLAVLAEPIAARLPGPRWVADGLGVTLAAQLGVAPVSLALFGSMPLASIPANLVAVPAAGPVMMWGLTGGVVAGALGSPVGDLAQLPVGLALSWVGGVARVGARLPLGQVGAGQLVGVVAAVVGAQWVGRRLPRASAGVGAGLCAAVLLGPLTVPAADARGRPLGDGAHLWRVGGAVVVVVDGAGSGSLLEALRRAEVTRIDLLVCTRGSRSVSGVVLDVRRRVHVGAILAPAGSAIRDASFVPSGTSVQVGGLSVAVLAGAPRLEVEVAVGDGPRAPPRGAGAGG